VATVNASIPALISRICRSTEEKQAPRKHLYVQVHGNWLLLGAKIILLTNSASAGPVHVNKKMKLTLPHMQKIFKDLNISTKTIQLSEEN
jgi:hypothetical protein